ncbi:hypothetical protein NOF55_14890 [Rhizobiaceae bacterium BDR2-2]|uniref:Uncharacterized protein n=1 Tax=Ectorhizobium quercum TaxID=2965071 RepID=A0AAE3N2B7_9HYPH|nr:hypothetical protein [Ectorhizobium quercum]MCX8998399.1 hypothetical protein [Ectorhizobium quercum]
MDINADSLSGAARQRRKTRRTRACLAPFGGAGQAVRQKRPALSAPISGAFDPRDMRLKITFCIQKSFYINLAHREGNAVNRSHWSIAPS